MLASYLIPPKDLALFQNHQQKRLKSIPQFLDDDAPFKRSQLYKLVNGGTIPTVKLGKRKYIDMVAWNRLQAGLSPVTE